MKRLLICALVVGLAIGLAIGVWRARHRPTPKPVASPKIGHARLSPELQQRLVEVSKAHAATLKGGR